MTTGGTGEGGGDRGRALKVGRDAAFADGADRPLRLRAFDTEDLAVIAAAVQDAVFPGTEMRWSRRERRFAILLNRYRWEDAAARTERVQAVLVIEDVRAVRSQGVTPGADIVFSLLDIGFERTGEGPEGRLLLTLAGDGAIAVEVEALEVVLRDVTRPYEAPSGRAPVHPD